ncbi:ABC transporter ATP-binding protein [Pseudohongiella spirulinae]|uniref:ABC transporter n=1 Tax=Pseudohongiella spirulinae TaxID=1249552 RepID=A0A0S2KAI7_9GAMM|nr:ABC transporter ATP-binding protein [Pseudohongiella spirulinae]ALO45335.1 ABC transporter [Pseudohongiella spirulinae]
MESVVSIKGLDKTYAGGHQALKNINLDIRPGEIFALLGPNGAGKTTLISSICGIAHPTSGEILVDGQDIQKNFRHTRSMIGLVPQELTTDAFETPWVTVNFSRGLFGKPADHAYVEQVLKDVSLWDKRHNKIMTLSGGMKRRLLIAKALAHQPRILFLDEPTAGVDVELRREMWQLVHKLRKTGVTIILTTHYIEEAEEMADRIGVIANGELILVEEKQALMQKLGKKELVLDIKQPLTELPASLQAFALEIRSQGHQLVYTFDSQADRTGITSLLDALRDQNIVFNDLSTTQSSLEEIFVQLLEEA